MTILYYVAFDLLLFLLHFGLVPSTDIHYVLSAQRAYCHTVGCNNSHARLLTRNL